MRASLKTAVIRKVKAEWEAADYNHVLLMFDDSSLTKFYLTNVCIPNGYLMSSKALT